MELNKQISYVRGLAEGLSFAEDSPEKKVLAALIDVVGELEARVDALCEQVGELSENAELMDSSIDDLFEILTEDDEEDGCRAHGDGCHHGEHDGCGCGHHRHHDEEDECGCGHCRDGEDGDLGLELNCPVCGEKIEITDEMWHSHVFKCPHCGDRLELDFGDDEEEDGDDDHEDD